MAVGEPRVDSTALSCNLVKASLKAHHSTILFLESYFVDLRQEIVY